MPQEITRDLLEKIDAEFEYRIPTDEWGTFRVGGSISHFTKFDQKIRGGETFSASRTARRDASVVRGPALIA